MKKTFLIFLLSFLIIFSFGFFLNINTANAVTPNISGWAWSSNIGWISFNSSNCNVTPRPVGCPTGVIPNYGVNIGTDGRMTGYAWSSNIGWIDFNPTGPFPTLPDHSARVELIGVNRGQVSGWVRSCAVFTDLNTCSGALNPNRGGWDGWIKMRGMTTEPVPREYGVSIDPATGRFSGWAWSNMVVGWISFTSRNCDADGVGGSDGTPNCPPVGTPIPIYDTVTNPNLFDRPPTATGLSNTSTPCLDTPHNQRHRLSWIFNDPGDTQTAFRVQVADNNVFNPIIYNSGEVLSSLHYYSPLYHFRWNTTYHWRVWVRDSHNTWSIGPTSTSFTTADHAHPRVSFSWSPFNPIINESVTFTNTSKCYPGGTIENCTMAWTFAPDGSPLNSTLRNPVVIFPSAGAKTVTLTVTGPGNLSCPRSKTITVDLRPPVWIEIPPMIWLRNFWVNAVDITQKHRDRIIAFVNNL